MQHLHLSEDVFDTEATCPVMSELVHSSWAMTYKLCFQGTYFFTD